MVTSEIPNPPFVITKGCASLRLNPPLENSLILIGSLRVCLPAQVRCGYDRRDQGWTPPFVAVRRHGKVPEYGESLLCHSGVKYTLF